MSALEILFIIIIIILTQNAANAIAVLPFVTVAATLSPIVRNYGLCGRKAALNVAACCRAFQLTS